jgi:hypothetical protein
MKLKVTLTDGKESTHEITPAVEVAFEAHAKGGFSKVFREHERQSDIYWLAWECLRRDGVPVKPVGDAFLDTLKSVDIVDDDPNG